MEEKHNTDTKEVKFTTQENTGGNGKGKEISWSGHAQQDFGIGSAGRGINIRSTGKRNAGGKGITWEERVEECGEVRWSGHAQQDFGRGSAGQNVKYRELKMGNAILESY